MHDELIRRLERYVNQAFRSNGGRHSHIAFFCERLQDNILITVHGLLHSTSATLRRTPCIVHLLDVDAPDPALEGAVTL
jgi:hypothetical protein